MNHFKRYGITYIVLLFISVIIIGFYVMNDKEIDINWKTLYGDEDIIKDLLIYGDGESVGASYFFNGMSPQFTLALDQSQRLETQRGWYYGFPNQDVQIEKYMDEYKNFMRGKDQWSERFVETDHQLIYIEGNNLAGMMDEDSKIEIEILDKETEEVSEFEVEIEKPEDMQIYHMDSMTYAHDKLYIQVYMEGAYHEQTGMWEDEYAILVIDLPNQILEDIKLPEKDIEQTADRSKQLYYQHHGLINGEMHYVYSYQEYQESINNEYGEVVSSQDNIRESAEEPPLFKDELWLYNVEEDNVQTIDLLENDVYNEHFLDIYDGTVYSGGLQGENYILTKLDDHLEEQEVIFDANVLNGDMEINQNYDLSPLTAIHNEYFYIVFPAYSTQTVTDISISAFDLETGENVYRGIIQGTDFMRQYQYLNLYQLEFQN